MAKGYRKVGIALGAGSARGLAHIGVLKVLEKEGIPIDFIAGSSIGAIVGVCYASGREGAKDIEGLVYSFNWRYILKLMTLFMPKFRTPEPEEVLAFLENRLEGRVIEDLTIPTAIVATDLFSGERVVFRRGDMFLALSASIAIPGVFSPVYLNGRFLVDGGVVDPVPVDVLKEMGAEVIIGVDVSPGLGLRLKRYKRGCSSIWRRIWNGIFQRKRGEGNLGLESRKEVKEPPPPPSKEVLLQAIDIMFRRITEDELNQPYVDVVIRPRVDEIQSGDFNKAPEIIAFGEEAAYRALPRIRKLIQRRWYHFIFGK
ncbi:MAG: patatin-like phospholipase family protein [Synergistetes bacterium]|nr:patatin-like phospholipase family protein [Synergistota bacterium]